VLKDISFEIKKGEFFGIVGRNGSGKSTLLKLLAAIYVPDKGLVQVNGSLTPFIELGVGFNPELTGRENVFLNGALLGFSQSEMDAMYNDIVKFAELEKFMDQKLKNYSSGMQVRLAFSIAIRAKGDILLLDEVLAVGDTIFQKKCYEYFKKLKKEKRTVVLVSHDTGVLQEYCTRGVLIDEGKIIKASNMKDIIASYTKIITKIESDERPQREEVKRWGTGEIEIDSITVGEGKSATAVFDEEHEITILVSFLANRPIEKPVFGITISDSSGQVIFQSNTLWLHIKVKDVVQGQRINVKFTLPNSFNTGTYSISPGVSDSTGVTVIDWREGFGTFKVHKQQKSHGVINEKHKLDIMYEQ
jgi:ABC-2 type transport system ATP-binding protein